MSAFTLTRRTALAAGSLAVAGLRPGLAAAQGMPVKVGELNSYSRMAAFAVPYRNGMQLGMEQINQAGGVMGGRPLEIVFRDDGSTPGDAVRVAEDLLTREGCAFIAGTFLSNVGLAVADLANQRRKLFMATEPLTDAITMAQGNRYTFRLRPGTYMQTRMLVEAARGKTAKRWAIVAPNYEYGQSAAANFKRLIGSVIPGAEIVTEQYPALGRIDAGATVGALAQSRPDGIFNVLFGADLTAFVREGNTRGLFENRTVLSLLTGEPEYLLPLGDECPDGWIVTGYPPEQIEAAAHKAFIAAYRAKYNEMPRLGSVLGFVTAHVMANLLTTAGSTETEKLVDTLAGLKTDTIVGPVTVRALDHQSTMGAWVGETVLRGRAGTMRNARYVDGADYLIPEAEVRAARPAS